MKRRSFLGGISSLAGGIAVAGLVASNVGAESLIDRLLNKQRRSGWNEQFDSQRVKAKPASLNMPIFSEQTPSLIEQAIQQYRKINANGGWPIVPYTSSLRLGAVSSAVPALRRRLIISGDLPASAGKSEVYDSWVDSGIRSFQARHGLPADGILGKYTLAALNIPASTRLGQLETNLIRLRSMSGFLGRRYVMVNIPAAHIEAVENGVVGSRHTAIVGRVERQSPVLNSKIAEINFNPYWNAPASIVKKDLIPLMQKDSTYLERNSIRIFGPDKQEIHPSQIDWNTEEAVNYHFRQDPGKNNAMASVKINFPNPHAVYMHDTPQQGLFNRLLRFESSGCVRVQNVRDLVVWLLKETPGWDRRAVENAIETGERIDAAMGEPVPVYFTYITAWANADGTVQFRDDIYRRDGVEELALGTLEN